ncbi:MAG TPA: GGDEF domain-containing protein [Candidatus Mediterraneibacter excrementavium]|nr:GGDEF domain-containing protein [Candidatus Mediterraneibacter excrementavium]
MKSRIKELLYLIRTELRNRRTFFRDGSASNCSSNLKLLIAANTTAILFLIAFILVTPLIISSWHPTPYHLAFLPALLICFAVSLIYYRGHRNGGKGASLLCILLSIILLTFSVLLDTIGSAGAPAIFVPMMYVIVPVVFTLPFHISYGMIAITEIAYAFMLSTYKNNMTGRYDLFGSIVALACSLIIANIITMLRVRDYMLQAEYKYRSMTDGLTNILNKEAIFDALRKYFQAYNPHTTCALIIMDLDNFKTLNDTKGHAAGDVLLKEIGRLLTETFRRLDIIGRFGGDEFVILLKGTADPLLIRNKYTTIQERLKQLTQEQLDIPVTASFGSVYAEGQTVDAHLLFQQADTALYKAKREKKSSCVIKKYQSET